MSTTTESQGPTVSGVLAQLMREAEWLAGEVFDMSEEAEDEDCDPMNGPDEDTRIVVTYKRLDDARYKARRVLALLPKIREAFPEETRGVDMFCEACAVHTDHDIDGHEEAVANTEACKAVPSHAKEGANDGA